MLRDQADNTRIHLSAETGWKADDEENRVWINGERGIVKLAADNTKDGNEDINLDTPKANLTLGGGSRPESSDLAPSEGDLMLQDRDAKTRVHLSAEKGWKADDANNRVWINGEKGVVKLGSVNTQWENQDIKLDSTEARIKVGGGKRDTEDSPDWRGDSVGQITVQDDEDNTRVDLSGEGRVELRSDDDDATIELDADEARATVGGGGTGGTLELDDGFAGHGVELDGAEGRASLGAAGENGSLELRNDDGDLTAVLRVEHFEPNPDVPPQLGGDGANDLVVETGDGTEAMRIKQDGTVEIDNLANSS